MHSCFLAELSNALGDKKNTPIFLAENDNVVHVLRNVDQESHVDMFAFWCEYDSVNRYCTVSVSLTCVVVSRGYTDHHQGRGHSIRLTAALINIHEHLI